MIDTDLIVKLLRDHGHKVESVFHVPENAGEYEFLVDGTLLTLSETRQLLEREDDHEEVSAQSIADADRIAHTTGPTLPKLVNLRCMPAIHRRKSVPVTIGNIRVGSDAPVVVQSMTNTDTADVESTVQQIAALARAGSEMVRITVNNDEAAKAVPYIVEGIRSKGWNTPIIGDFHYNGHLLLSKYPDTAEALAKYRINPGNCSIGRKDDDNFRTMVEVAVKHQKPVRIGGQLGLVRPGPFDEDDGRELRLAQPLDARDVMMEAMVVSALDNAAAAERYGLRRDQIILSAKVSGVRDLIDVYTELASRCDYALHLGLTEAGNGHEGRSCLDRWPGSTSPRRHRRYHPRLAHAHPRRRPL